MKPGPATSARVDLVDRRPASATISSASARGLVPARLASTIAALVARSPCAGSRGGSTATAARSTPRRQRAFRLEGVEHGVEMRGKAGVEGHWIFRGGQERRGFSGTTRRFEVKPRARR